jgi:3'-phosphoadenosine 5'-phosphosulfate sulfotransferase (PAPS reductase)/FAD synthetase
MVGRRFAARPDVPSFPSAQHRQCTPDLKRGPIGREIRRWMRDRGLPPIVSCSGIRAAKSAQRAKVEVPKLNTGNPKAGREWYDWAPTHTPSTEQVLATIAAAGQSPHPAYTAGNERLPCVSCIMGPKGDIARGALARPELFARHVEPGQRTGHTMHMSRKPLTQLVAEAQLNPLPLAA